jgi:predicted nucleic acid-binding protein
MTSLIVDASVAVKWFIAEEDHEKALRLRTPEFELIAPELILAEIGNAFWKRSHHKLLSAGDVHDMIRLAHRPFSWLVPLADLLVDASDLSTRLDHPICDCFYLTLAQRHDAPLVTADSKLAKAAGRVGVKVERL